VPEQADRPPDGVRGGLRRTGCLAGAVLLGCALFVGTASLAAAAPAPATPPPSAASGATTLCHITDPRLPELSGLVAVRDKLLAINDGGDQVEVYVLDARCQVVDVHTAAIDPYDPEDLALAGDGTVWIADIGDNGADRATVALIALRPDGTSSVFRLAYPDGPHDAESLLLAPDGTPYLVTKEVLGASGVYRPGAPLVDNGTVGLVKVATVNFGLTGTPGGPVGRAGQLMATGGAVSGDGRLLALRTYTDAYVWPLTGSDVPAALGVKPTRLALPEAPQGEGITFSADNRHLIVGGEGSPSDLTVVPLSGAVEAAAAPTTAPSPLTDPVAALQTGRSPITSALIAAVVAAAVVWVGSKFRRRRG
jgi:hypothetical protein